MTSDSESEIRPVPLATKPSALARRIVAVAVALVALAVAGRLVCPLVQAQVFFLSQGQRLGSAQTLEGARETAAETGAVLRVLPSGEWLLGNAVTMHMHVPFGYDAIIICASDGTAYTSNAHMCVGNGELVEFLEALDADDLEEIRPKIEENDVYSFHAR